MVNEWKGKQIAYRISKTEGLRRPVRGKLRRQEGLSLNVQCWQVQIKHRPFLQFQPAQSTPFEFRTVVDGNLMWGEWHTEMEYHVERRDAVRAIGVRDSA